MASEILSPAAEAGKALFSDTSLSPSQRQSAVSLQKFVAAYGEAVLDNPDTALRDIGLALAAHETEDPDFHPFSSKFDYWQQGQAQFMTRELAGLALFNNPGKGNCTAGPDVPLCLVPRSAAPGDYGYWPRNQDRVWTVGANFYTTPHVVFKADYQWFDLNRDFSRFDLGLGLNF